MWQKIVNSYEMGYQAVQLVAREDLGGEYYLVPEPGHVPRIRVGIDYEYWREVVAVLLHEAMELAIDVHRAKYKQTNQIANDHGNYLFVMDHSQFTQVCAEVAEFVAFALPDLRKAYIERRRRKKK